MNMSFSEAFKFYFTNLLDLTGYITIVFFVATLFLLIVKKTDKKWKFGLMIIVPILAGMMNLLFDALFFGLSGSSLIPAKYTGMLFSISKSFIASFFLYFTYRKDRPNQFLSKLTTLIASIFIVNTISKALGLFAGVSSTDNFYAVSFARSAPFALLILTAYVIRKYDINHFKTLSKELLVALYVTNIVIISIAMFDSTLDEHNLNINILITIISLTLYFLMILLYYSMFKVNEYRHKAINHKVQSKLAMAKINSLAIDKVNKDEISKIKHDIKNQISYLGLLLEQEKYEEAKEYIADYTDRNIETLNTFMCPNEVINSIVNLELTKAKLYNINIKAKAVVPSHLPFKDIDLCSLMTNILDNAIENCDPESDTPIIFSVIKQQDFIRIYCENTINKKLPHNVDNTSTKKEKGHGYGLKIIKNIAKSYGGYAYFDKKDDKFITDVLLELGEGMKNV